MEPHMEENHILSEIQRSIQNAFAVLNLKDYFGSREQISLDDDPITSLYDSKEQERIKTLESPTICSNVTQLKRNSPQSLPSPKEITESIKTNILAKTPRPKSNTTSLESMSFPFLEDPVKNTVEKMQNLLNARSNVAPQINETSPEEILNLYSKDLGISLSNNSSPKGDGVTQRQYQPMSGNEPKVKQQIRSRKDSKQLKQVKSKGNSEKKLNSNIIKTCKTEMITKRDVKLKELKSIYGGGSLQKTKARHSDSTLGSRSEISKITSSKKLKQIKDSNKASSTVLSRKSRRKSYLNKSDMELFDAEFLAQEKSSRLSIKKKIKQKNNTENAKTSRKASFKRKTVSLHETVDICDDSQIYNIDYNNNSSKFKVNNVNFKNSSNKRNKLNNKTNFKVLKKATTGPDKFENSVQTVNERLIKNTGMNSLPTIPQNKLQTENKYNDVGGIEMKSFSNTNTKTQTVENEKVANSLTQKTSDETKLNKHVLFPIDDQKEDHFGDESHTLQNFHLNNDNFNDFYVGQEGQLHYTLPTLSSRSKEVERFLNGHYQHLPFVIGQSINKSHNLWVNIQEALSLMKQKLPQTVEMQSVDVEYDCRESERPLTVLSKFTTKSSKKPHHCPAIMSDSLYAIPEVNTEVDETVLGKSWEDSPECINANIDPSCVRSRCSCSTQQGTSYKAVLRQIFGGGLAETNDSSVAVCGDREDSVLHQDGGDSYTAELRKALVSFTEEFENMNNKYEEMLMDPNADKEELKRLEMQLENKEEEIKEIIAKFNEVKEFQHRACIEGTKSRPGFLSLEPFKSTTSIRLAQTLHRVQKFKESLKRRPSVPYLTKRNQHIGYY